MLTGLKPFITSDFLFMINKIIPESFFFKFWQTLIKLFSIGLPSLKTNKIKILKTGGLGDFIFLIPTLNYIRQSTTCKVILFFGLPNKSTAANVKSYNRGSAIEYVEFFKPLLFDEIVYINNKISFSLIIKNLFDTFSHKFIVLRNPGEHPIRLLKKIIFFRLNGVLAPIYGTEFNYYRSFSKSKLLSNNQIINLQNHYEANFNSLKSVFQDLDYNDLLPLDIYSYFEKSIVNRYLKDFDLENQNYIVLSIGSLKPHKIWPFHNFINLIRLISSDFKGKIVLTGTIKDLQIARAITDKSEIMVLNLVGETDFKKLLVLLAQSRLVIGNDGGALHLAASFGKKVIAITPALEPKGSVAPIFNDHNQLINSSLACAPCYQMEDCPLRTYECINSISVDSVFHKFQYIINR